MTTEQKAKRLIELAGKAAKGDWNASPLSEARVAGRDMDKPPLYAIQTRKPFLEITRGYMSPSDAHFIAAARNDAPEIAEELLRVMRENDELKEVGRKMYKEIEANTHLLRHFERHGDSSDLEKGLAGAAARTTTLRRYAHLFEQEGESNG